MKTTNVVAAIIIKDNKLFATQRGYGDFKDGWEFPGGKVEEGETPEEALVREIREELDAEIRVGELFDTVEYDYPDFHLSMNCYICELASEEMTLKEHEAAKWLTCDTLDTVEWLPADLGLIGGLEKRLKEGGNEMAVRELIDAAAEAAKNTYEVQNPVEVVEEAAEETGRNPFKKVKGAAQKIGGIKGEITGEIQHFKDVREAKKQLNDARQQVLENATLTFSLSDYAKGVQREDRDNRLLDVFDVKQLEGKTGAFVIATYKRIDLDKDLFDYTGVYVGMGEDVREEMEFVMSRKGDPDVYADVKYFQNVRFYLFECTAEEMQGCYDGLLQAFTDERLYND